MQHRNNTSNAWVITHANSLLDVDSNGNPLWETQCRGKGNAAALYSNVIDSKADAEKFNEYLNKKGMKSSIEPVSDAGESFRIVLPVSAQQLKKTRFNTAHTDVTDDHALEKIIHMLNDATPDDFAKWEVSANHSGQRQLLCIAHHERTRQDSHDAQLLSMIIKLLGKGAFSEESRRSIKHYFLDNLYVEEHENYTVYTIIDLAFMQQIELIESMS